MATQAIQLGLDRKAGAIPVRDRSGPSGGHFDGVAGYIIAFAARDGVALFAQAGQHTAGRVRQPIGRSEQFSNGRAAVAAEHFQHEVVFAARSRLLKRRNKGPCPGYTDALDRRSYCRVGVGIGATTPYPNRFAARSGDEHAGRILIGIAPGKAAIGDRCLLGQTLRMSAAIPFPARARSLAAVAGSGIRLPS